MTNMKQAQEALKLFYLPGLQFQLNNATPILAVMDRDQKSVVGSEIRMALRYGRHGGIGNRADDGDLPTPRSRQTKQAKWETKNIFGHIQISDKTMRASRGDGAFVSLLEADLEDALNDAKDDLERQLFGDGSGKMATCGVTTASNEVEVDDTRNFAEGQIVDIVTAASGVVLAGGREILSVNHKGNTITISGAPVTTASTDIVTRAGNFGLELTGLDAIFTPDNTLYGIDRTKNTWFNPTVIDNVGTISEVKIQEAIDEADRRAGGKVNLMATTYGVRRAYQELLLATKRTTDTMKLKGGYDVLLYNDKPLTVSKYAPEGVLYGLDMDTFKLYHIMDWNWLDEDGAILSRVPNKAVWSAILARYMDLGMNKPAGSFKMSGITEA
ncbi:phage major capsid protein [Lysinibacillus fusiformis]|uniref:phage major capsid protein n=1 Tax=Lysinibacillus fusiformis TaxID=28031 RepID=UPI00263BCE8A|nr:phage major capsid protein [Lysinibacillus fusiformis]MDC6267725.1 phage major capsid protein [Lysinibacillus sphaericus]MDN4967785.1 phage major capsid protein [Lysinibacillus fusiformis]MDN4967841.1 phage major capsid protein [Lysinibacillus fusiformis]